MHVLLVHPSPLMYSEIYLRLEPLGLERVAAAVRAAGHDVRLLDLQIFRHRDYARELEDFKPDAVGFSVNWRMCPRSSSSRVRHGDAGRMHWSSPVATASPSSRPRFWTTRPARWTVSCAVRVRGSRRGCSKRTAIIGWRRCRAS